jgi:hypothetical protein
VWVGKTERVVWVCLRILWRSVIVTKLSMNNLRFDASQYFTCLALSYTRLVLGGSSPLGRAAALLARCPPPATSHLGLLYACAVQIVTRVPLSLYLGPRLVNVVLFHAPLCRCVSCALCENLRAPNRTPGPGRCSLRSAAAAARCLRL